MARDHDTTVLIIGGGIGGLTTAIALRHYGIDSLVCEQADDLRKTQVGSGLSLGVNVGRAFKHLGLRDELEQLGAPMRRLNYRNHTGQHLGSLPLAEDGELAVGVIRPAFHRFLTETIGQDSVRLGATLSRFEQDADGVTAHFADGRDARSSVLVGADGLYSTVRRQLLGESELRYAGYCTRRGVVETDFAKEGLFGIVLGPGLRFLVLSRRALVHVLDGVHERAGRRQGGRRDHQAHRSRAVPRLARAAGGPCGSHRPVQHFLADTYDRNPVQRWGEGRVTLLGDAAHPMTWDRGQGAGQAIEDAVFLAKVLSRSDDPQGALRAWEAKRIPRTTKLVRYSRQIGRLQQAASPLARVYRERVMLKLMTSEAGAKRGTRDLLVEY